MVYMKKIAVGIMSGTSLDGIDVVISEIEGQSLNTKVNIINAKTYSYSPELLEKIKKCISIDESTVELICSVNFEISIAYSECVKDLCKISNINLNDVAFIASHGQTVFHINEQSNTLVKSSLQIGDGSVLANLTNTTVVSNFRTADIAVGGCGAPLVPYADYILFRDKHKTRLLQNIGGIANVTVLVKNALLEDIYAFDNGPGNMMIDHAMKVLYDQSYDNNGNTAAKGTVIPEMLVELLDNNYFVVSPPKSTGREMFGIEYTNKILNKYSLHNKEDIISTLTHFTAKTIADSYHNFIENFHKIDELIISGGGTYNSTLIQLIRDYSNIENIKFSDDIGIDSSYKEAVAFIILANETLHFGYSNILKATGAQKHTILGQVSYVLK